MDQDTQTNNTSTPAKVMIVEDEPFLSDLIAGQLAEAGMNLLLVQKGSEVVSKASQEQPDVILLDLVLPEMTGFDALKVLKENASTKDIPVLVLSNLGGEGDIQKATELGAVAYMVKAHTDPGEVVTKVKEILVTLGK